MAKCQLCNSRSHTASGCWLPRHRYYQGLVSGMLHANPELERLYRTLIMSHQVDARIEEIKAWAWQKAQTL